MLISIIVPVYNVEGFLEECLKGVFHEVRPGYEVIIVNDGSTDNSALIIDRFKIIYPDTVVIEKKNGGLSSARNAGMQVAKGKYLLFIDSDDILEQGVLDKLLKNAIDNNADIAVADYYEFEFIDRKKERYDKSIIGAPLVSEQDRLSKLFTIEVSFAVWNKIYNAEFLKKRKLAFLEGYWFEDLDFVFRAFYYAEKIVKENGMLIGYRQRTGSIMKSISPKILDKMEIMERIGHFLKEEGKFGKYEDLYNILYLKMAFSIIYSCVKNSSDKIKAKSVLEELYDLSYFQKVIKSPLKSKFRMKRNEIIFYNLIKLGVINPSTLMFLTKLI